MKKLVSKNKERLIYIFFILILIGLVALSLINCDEIVKDDKSKPLSQKEEIIDMINLKIKYSDDRKEIEVLKDLKISIMVRIKDEVKTNG